MTAQEKIFRARRALSRLAKSTAELTGLVAVEGMADVECLLWCIDTLEKSLPKTPEIPDPREHIFEGGICQMCGANEEDYQKWLIDNRKPG